MTSESFEKNPSNWLSLQPMSVESAFIVTNQDEIIAVPYCNTSKDWCERRHNGDGIYKYNHKNDKWVKYISYPTTFISTYHSIALNELSQQLYIINMENTLQIIDLKSNKFTTKDMVQKVDDWFPIGIYQGCSCIFLNGKYNLFAGTHKCHLQLNNKFEFVSFDFNELKKHSQYFSGLIYVKNKNSLFLFGGEQISLPYKKLDCIWCYELNEKKWQKMDAKLPYEMSHIGCCYHEKTENIIIFDCDRIWIWNLLTMTFRESVIKSPLGTERCQSIMISNINSELIVFGYVREYWLNTHFGNATPFPHKYIINLIEQWYHCDYIHLFAMARTPTLHWKINVFDIIN
eukprot:53969_1